MTSDRKSPRWALGASLVGALAAGLLAVSCCIGPLVLGILGFGGAGALAVFGSHQGALRVLTLILLGTGFLLTYGRRWLVRVRIAWSAPPLVPRTETPVCDCPEPPRRRTRNVAEVMLWGAVLAVAASWVSPTVIAASLRRTSASSSADASLVASSRWSTARLSVVGLTCKGCVPGIMEVLRQAGPIRDFQADLKRQQVTFDFAGRFPDIERFADAIRELGYDVQGIPVSPSVAERR